MRHIGEILSAAIEEINDHLDPEFKDVYQGEIHQRMVDYGLPNGSAALGGA